MHNVHVFNSFDKARLNQHALQLFQRHLFISLKVWIMKIFFVQVLILDYLDFSETVEVCQIQSVVSCHLDILVFTWCAEVFPLLFLATELFHRSLSFPRWSFVTLSSEAVWCDWTPWKSWCLGFDEKAHRAPSGRGSGVGGEASEGAWQNCSSADLSNVSARSRWLRDAFSIWKCCSLHVETVFVLCICSCFKIYVRKYSMLLSGCRLY